MVRHALFAQAHCMGGVHGTVRLGSNTLTISIINGMIAARNTHAAQLILQNISRKKPSKTLHFHLFFADRHPFFCIDISIF